MKCDNCKMKRVCDELERMGKVQKHESCRCYSPEKPITNYDRLIRKTPEEMAEFIRDQIIDRNIGIPSETWLDWLKQEASE